MANDTVYADLLDSLSPLTKAGIDPDAARVDRAGTMAKLMGTDTAAPPSWIQQARDQQQAGDEVAQNDAPPQLSPNGNTLPPGLRSRIPPPAAAAPTTSAAVPASVTPSGDAKSPSLATGNAGTIGLMQKDYARASQDVQNEASQPDLASVTRNLEAQRQNAAQPVNAYDPQTGKLLDEYKPSFGQRLIRGVEGFARGGVLGVVDPKLAGAPAYGAPNDEYGREVQQKNQIVGSLDQQLKQAADNYKATSDRLAKVAADRRALATTGRDVANSSTDQQKIPIQQQQADADTQNAATKAAQESRESYQNSPEGKAAITAAQFDAAQKKADALGLRGQHRVLYLANGRLPDPRQPTADEIATHQAEQVFTQQNGHPPRTLDEFNEVRRAAKGADKQLGTNGKPLPTTADRNRSSLAHVADDNLRQIEDIVNRRPDLFGAGGGRISSVDQMIGSDDPDLQALGNAAHNFAMANAGIHGSRSFENVQAAQRELLNGLKSGPNGVRGAINSNRENLKTIIERVEGGDTSSPGSGDDHPSTGDIVDGYKFKGGDPSQQSNWEKVK